MIDKIVRAGTYLEAIRVDGELSETLPGCGAYAMPLEEYHLFVRVRHALKVLRRLGVLLLGFLGLGIRVSDRPPSSRRRRLGLTDDSWRLWRLRPRWRGTRTTVLGIDKGRKRVGTPARRRLCGSPVIILGPFGCPRRIALSHLADATARTIKPVSARSEESLPHIHLGGRGVCLGYRG
jgi:hypothetical protein